MGTVFITVCICLLFEEAAQEIERRDSCSHTDGEKEGATEMSDCNSMKGQARLQQHLYTVSIFMYYLNRLGFSLNSQSRIQVHILHILHEN